MDEITSHNQARWNALSSAHVEYARPLLDLTAESAWQFLDPAQVMGDVRTQEVLCLASGGGQQSVAFGLLGAQVTVVDFSERQLAQDKQALAHYGLTAQLIQGDMRDLSVLAERSFDLVYHAYSINFIPDAASAFDAVCRVLRPGGLYRLQWHNPFMTAADEESWDGKGYRLIAPYRDGEMPFRSTLWTFTDDAGNPQQIEGPREFNHPLSLVLNGLIARRFRLLGLWEEWTGDASAEPGSWPHFLAFAPQLLTIWARYEPLAES